jgi:hypothetical protein
MQSASDEDKNHFFCSNGLKSPPIKRRKREIIIDLTNDMDKTACSENTSIVSGIKRWKGRRVYTRFQEKTNPEQNSSYADWNP